MKETENLRLYINEAKDVSKKAINKLEDIALFWLATPNYGKRKDYSDCEDMTPEKQTEMYYNSEGFCNEAWITCHTSIFSSMILYGILNFFPEVPSVVSFAPVVTNGISLFNKYIQLGKTNAKLKKVDKNK